MYFSVSFAQLLQKIPKNTLYKINRVVYNKTINN
nr:MAG TPA: hypothetical protein [Caudoviricetes sp.]